MMSKDFDGDSGIFSVDLSAPPKGDCDFSGITTELELIEVRLSHIEKLLLSLIAIDNARAHGLIEQERKENNK